MAQAAKHLRKNKDLEALAEQERKEKEEETIKKRSRSRDKKRKVLVLFTGGVIMGGVMGVRWGGSGGWRGQQEGWDIPPPPLLSLSEKLWSRVPGHTWKPSHERVSTVCTHSLPGTHACPAHTDTGKRYNTLHAFLLLSTALYLLYWLSCLTCLIR